MSVPGGNICRRLKGERAVRGRKCGAGSETGERVSLALWRGSLVVNWGPELYLDKLLQYELKEGELFVLNVLKGFCRDILAHIARQCGWAGGVRVRTRRKRATVCRGYKH